MVYGHYITDTAGNERFFVEGCNHCQMSTGGQHESNCPCKDIKVAEKIDRTFNFRAKRDIRIFKYDDEGNFIKEIE